MNTKETSSSDPALVRLPGLLPELEALYTDVHAHPELSMQETRTAGLAAERLRAVGYDDNCLMMNRFPDTSTGMDATGSTVYATVRNPGLLGRFTSEPTTISTQDRSSLFNCFLSSMSWSMRS